jgi:peptide/nickel transport system ATP-binding protein
VKKHIVLEGDIPSAMNPPSGCPFQTRCRWKKFVPDNKCETELPPLRDLGAGHRSLCWLDDKQLATMEPVISFDSADAAKAYDILPDDPPHGAGPGLVGTPPQRPHGKTASAEAGEEADASEQAEARTERRTHERQDEASENPAKPDRNI